MLRRHCADEVSKHAAIYANHAHIQRVAREIGETTTVFWHNLLGEDSLPSNIHRNTALPLFWVGMEVSTLGLASATQSHIVAHSDSGELTGTQRLGDSANDAGQQMSSSVWARPRFARHGAFFISMSRLHKPPASSCRNKIWSVACLN